MKFYAGIDISLSKAGYARIDEGKKLCSLETFSQKAPVKIDRVIAHVDSIMSDLLSVKSELEFVSIEEPLWNQTRFVSYDIGMAYGVMLEHLTRAKINHIIVHPLKLRSFVLPRRYKGKVPTRLWCEKQGVRFPKVRQEFIFDMADAYVLARIAHLFGEFRKDLTKQYYMPDHQQRIFRGPDSKGREVGLLNRPDLYRVF